MEEERVKIFLRMTGYEYIGKKSDEKIRNMCIAKMCRVVGIKCEQCYNSRLFQIFGTILGEAVCCNLMMDFHVASEDLRYVSFGGVNFVEQSMLFLTRCDVDEAVLDIFNLVDEHKTILLSKFEF